MVYIENKVVKKIFYYMRDVKIFVISNNLENHSYMTSNNPVIGSWLDIVFHLYMISCNPVKSSWQDIIFHSYMTSNIPVIGSWLDVVFHLYQII